MAGEPSRALPNDPAPYTFLPIFDEGLMDRREFLAATAVAAMSSTPKLDTLAQSTSRQYIELRRYQLLPGTKQRAFITFVGVVALSAMNRAGVVWFGAVTELD